MLVLILSHRYGYVFNNIDLPHIVIPSPFAVIVVVVRSESLARAGTTVLPVNWEIQPMNNTDDEPK